MAEILIVDDDAHINDMLSEALEAEGYSVIKSYSGTEALLVLENKIPDLVLLDLMIPGLSGEELLPKIKDIPVIVISAKSDVNDKVGMLLNGAADYITKPFNMYLDMIENTDDPEKKSKYISIIRERTEIMKQLTEELFQYSMVVSDDKELELEDVFVNQVLEESIGSFYPALTEKNIVPEINICSEKIYRRLNKQALSRIFANLLNNAVKYSDGDLKIILLSTGEMVFENTAKALSSVKAEQLFDRFFTVKTSSNSTGLGLSIAKNLVERMNGNITADYKDNMLKINIWF